MSEKLFAWLLRLYPSRFREAYGDEALQLIRDRARDEKGFLLKLRLWLDLLVDLAISVPREGRQLQPRLATDSPQLSFHVLADETPGSGALLFGGAVSLITLGALPFLISHFGSHAQAAGPDFGGVTGQAVIEHVMLDATDRQRVIAGVIESLKRYYIYPDAAQKMADALLVHEYDGDHNKATDGESLATLLTTEMRDVSHDRHLALRYNRAVTAGRPPGTPDCNFEKIETLPHNIGYLRLNSFPNLASCQSTAMSAMASLNNADAIIFDLRDNRGGSPDMVALIATYLFDRRTHLNDFYNRAENSTRQSWTRAPVPGNKLADKPAYVLTSASTFSGGEEFSYDLKMLKRATIVGETTGGGAYLTSWRRVDDRFTFAVPFARPINPISKTDWEGTGVQPDVKVPAAEALATAERLAETQLRKK